MSAEIKWIASERFDRVGRFRVEAEPERLFPLLCPVVEYKWLPGWSCTMVHSRSGVAEKDAVFHTREKLHKKAVWTTITYEPPRFIEYLIVNGSAAVVRLSALLERAGAHSTDLTWTMRFTISGGIFSKILKDRFSERNFAIMMKEREEQLNTYFSLRRKT